MGRSQETLVAEGYERSSYWERTQRPLQSLGFLLPLILVYEVGVRLYGTDHVRGATQDILARSMLFRFFDWFGINGYYWPGLIVVAVLVCWHLVQKDPWRIEPRLCGWMWIESMALAVPLFVCAVVLFRSPAQAAVSGFPGSPGAGFPGFYAQGAVMDGRVLSWQAELVFSIGAGIYEELLFRLIAIAMLHLILVDVAGLPERVGAVGAIAVSSVLFALYHFSSQNPFDAGKFLFYTLGGGYFAGVYLLRGFGIVAGTHAVYDILVVVL